MNLVKYYLNQSTYKKILIGLIFIGLQMQAIYFVLVYCVKKEYQNVSKLHKQQMFSNQQLRAELSKIDSELFKLKEKKSGCKMIMANGLCLSHLTTIITQSAFAVDKMTTQKKPRAAISLTARGDFLQFYDFLKQCHKHNILINNFYLHKEELHNLLIILKMIQP